MNIEFKLPELGENITSGDVVNVLVREGQEVAAGQGIIELETDKAVVEVPCPQPGRIAKIHVQKGQTVKVGQALVTVEGEAKGEGGEAKAEGGRGKAEDVPILRTNRAMRGAWLAAGH